jgi:transposase
VAYEATRRRRVNALVAYRPLGPRPTLRFLVRPRTLTARDVVAFLRRLTASGRPCVVVLDNLGLHTARLVQRALPRLRTRGLRLFYLPAYSPELNDIEPVFGVVKAHEMPQRSYATLEALLNAVRTALRRYRQRLRSR